MAREHAQRSNGMVDAIGATYKTLLRESGELLSKEGMTLAQFLAQVRGREGSCSDEGDK